MAGPESQQMKRKKKDLIEESNSLKLSKSMNLDQHSLKPVKIKNARFEKTSIINTLKKAIKLT